MDCIANHPLADVRVLVFDLFGTVFQWREHIENACRRYALTKLSGLEESVLHDGQIEKDLHNMDWKAFAQEWRDSYSAFTKNYNPETDTWKTVDEHHFDSLNMLLQKTPIGSFCSDNETASLSDAWHHLSPHDDCSGALEHLGKHYTLSTLTNANTAIVRELVEDLPFEHWICAEDFKAYKPNPKVYLGAARKLEHEPRQIALVASHLSDLQAARSHGYRTIYVARKGEEVWNESQKHAAREWVDLWVTEEAGGLRVVEEKLRKIRDANNAPEETTIP